jgi:hypothetical protein
MNKSIKISLFLFGLIWILVAVQFAFSPFKLVGLRGAFVETKSPVFTVDKVLDGSFQAEVSSFSNSKTPFRSDFIRLKNQLGYSLFKEVNTNLELGKENYLFDPSYAKAYYGEDKFSDSVNVEWARIVKSFKTRIDSIGVRCIFVIAPNKGRFYNEYIIQEKKSKTIVNNQEILESILIKNNIPVLNVDDWFDVIKDKSKYPLIPKYGAHWSTYGASLVVDSLNKRLTDWFPEIAKTSIGNIELSKKHKFTDGDYIPSLNLISSWNSPVELAYPGMIYEKGKPLNAVVISDSYMWNFFHNDYFKRVFDNKSDFLYYNKSYYNLKREKVAVKDSNYPLGSLSKKDIVLIIATGPSIKKEIGYGFFKEILDQ